MSKQYLDKEGLQVIANKVNKKQDKFDAGTSLQFVTSGEGEITDVLYAGLDNVLTDELPSSSRTDINVTDPVKALSIANQLVQVQFFGFIDATMVSITALSPQTSVGAAKGDVVTPTETVTLLPYTNSVSREYTEWCSAHGVSFDIPWEYNTTLTVYLSSQTLIINKTLNYKPDDTQLSDESSWSSLHTRNVITSLLPLPLADSDTATIEESSIPTWSDVEKVEQNDEVIDTNPTIVDKYLLQKFLWNTTVGATELPQTMQVQLDYREIYIGVYGYFISCNGMMIGQTIDAPNEGSAMFEKSVGITWDYWAGGTYTVTFDNSSTCPVQKINVTGAEDEEARETAAGAIGLAQQVSEKVSGKISYVGKESNYNLYPWNHTRTEESADTNQDITIERDGWYSIDYTLSNSADANQTFTLRDFDTQGEVHTIMRACYDKSGTFRQTFLIPLKAGTYRYSHGGIGTLAVYMNRRDMI